MVDARALFNLTRGNINFLLTKSFPPKQESDLIRRTEGWLLELAALLEGVPQKKAAYRLVAGLKKFRKRYLEAAKRADPKELFEARRDMLAIASSNLKIISAEV